MCRMYIAELKNLVKRIENPILIQMKNRVIELFELLFPYTYSEPKERKIDTILHYCLKEPDRTTAQGLFFLMSCDKNHLVLSNSIEDL